MRRRAKAVISGISYCQGDTASPRPRIPRTEAASFHRRLFPPLTRVPALMAECSSRRGPPGSIGRFFDVGDGPPRLRHEESRAGGLAANGIALNTPKFQGHRR